MARGTLTQDRSRIGRYPHFLLSAFDHSSSHTQLRFLRLGKRGVFGGEFSVGMIDFLGGFFFLVVVVVRLERGVRSSLSHFAFVGVQS